MTPKYGPAMPNELPTRVPARPPSSPARKKVMTMNRSTLMPSKDAVPGFSATALSALPMRVRPMTRPRISSKTMLTAKMMTCTVRMMMTLSPR